LPPPPTLWCFALSAPISRERLAVDQQAARNESAGMKEYSCFAVSDGRRGIENQVMGLAEALARLLTLRILPVHIERTGALPDPGAIKPDIWIGCGRGALRAAPYHRHAFAGTKFIYIQDPRTRADMFDLVIPPRHDRMKGSNVFPILGSPNLITPERLAEGAAHFAAKLDALPSPRAAMLIGGDSRHHRFSRTACAHILERIEAVRTQTCSLMITTSRRTPDTLVSELRQRFKGDPSVWLHDGSGANPYFAFLAGADWIFVTEDSTNMLTEAACTGKPVYRLHTDGDPGKFRRLYSELEGHGAVRPFLGRLEHWTYPALHETERAARRILEILGAVRDMDAA